MVEQSVQTDHQHHSVTFAEANSYASPEPPQRNASVSKANDAGDEDDDNNNNEDDADDLLKTPVVMELSNTLSNLKWGFKKRYVCGMTQRIHCRTPCVDVYL